MTTFSLLFLSLSSNFLRAIGNAKHAGEREEEREGERQRERGKEQEIE